MPLHGFKEKRVRDTLIKVANERRSRSDLELRLLRLEGKSASARDFIIILADPIAAATYDEGDDEWTLGEGEAQVFRRKRTDSDIGCSQFLENNVGGFKLEQVLDVNGDPLLKRVFNYYQTEAPADTPLTAMQDVYGDLYIIGLTTANTTPTPLTVFTNSFSWTGSNTLEYAYPHPPISIIGELVERFDTGTNLADPAGDGTRFTKRSTGLCILEVDFTVSGVSSPGSFALAATTTTAPFLIYTTSDGYLEPRWTINSTGRVRSFSSCKYEASAGGRPYLRFTRGASSLTFSSIGYQLTFIDGFIPSG